jgi:DnaJ-class molecular chaperone
VSEQAAEPTAPERCSACRGTGSVISNLGGEPHQLGCPWCDGGGVVLPGHDAQAHWRERQSADERA